MKIDLTNYNVATGEISIQTVILPDPVPPKELNLVQVLIDKGILSAADVVPK
jgi:hypothetical protein